MTRLLIILPLIFCPVFVLAAEWSVSTGIGVRTGRDVWVDTDAFVRAVPTLSFRYGNWRFNARGLRYRLEDEPFGVRNIGISYRRDGYNPNGLLAGGSSNAQVFEGYNRPDGELVFTLEQRIGFIGINLQQDISGGSDGTVINLGSGLPLYTSDKWRLNWGLKLAWHSSSYTQTFYGIDSSQAAPELGRFEYSPGQAVNIETGVNAEYHLTKRWRLSASASTTRIDSVLFDSPLVARRTSWRGLVSVRYRFNI